MSLTVVALESAARAAMGATCPAPLPAAPERPLHGFAADA